MKILTILFAFVFVLTASVWTPEPTESPKVQVIGTATIVGNHAVILMDNHDMEAKMGSDVDKSELFPPESHVEDWQYYMEFQMTGKELPKGTKTIGRFAFARSGLKSITLPEGLDSIGYAAFYHCDDLKEVKIPATVTRIAANAFTYTAWMEGFLDGTTYHDSDFLIVGDGILLAYRGSAETVLIPEGVKTIATECFLNHKEIKTVIYPSTLEKIEEDAFKGCAIELAE